MFEENSEHSQIDTDVTVYYEALQTYTYSLKKS